MSKSRKIPKRIKQTWDDFVNKFTPEYILNDMTMKEYVIGHGSDNKSFCYIIERELDALGGIRGATSSKFGLYYGKTKKDQTDKYRPTQKFGSTPEQAFERIKIELSNLIIEAKKLTKFKDLDSLLSGMFKYKIMYIYNPEIMIPSFNMEDMEYFAERLGLNPEHTFERLQNQLLEHKKSKYPELTNHEYMAFLYETFGKHLSREELRANDENDRKLNEAVRYTKKPKEQYITHVEAKKDFKKYSDDVVIYPRDPKMAAYALANANYSCENNPSHECFVRRKDDTPYTEVHHLIPLCFQDEFDNSLDVPENIVSLCSNCHNEIHYGKHADKIIAKLYSERKDKLEAAGIFITLEELLSKYNCISKKE